MDADAPFPISYGVPEYHHYVARLANLNWTAMTGVWAPLDPYMSIWNDFYWQLSALVAEAVAELLS